MPSMQRFVTLVPLKTYSIAQQVPRRANSVIQDRLLIITLEIASTVLQTQNKWIIIAIPVLVDLSALRKARRVQRARLGNFSIR